MIDAAVLSASDRSSRGLRKDVSGRVLEELLPLIPARPAGYRLVPDRVGAIRSALRALAGRQGMRLVLTTGGTGLAPRDVTPEATRPLLDRELPGLALAVRWESYSQAPRSILSRALAGFRGECLVVNMPGSPRAVRECFDILLPTFRWLFGRGQQKGR